VGFRDLQALVFRIFPTIHSLTPVPYHVAVESNAIANVIKNCSSISRAFLDNFIIISQALLKYFISTSNTILEHFSSIFKAFLKLLFLRIS
jgi:hypothetical protein